MWCAKNLKFMNTWKSTWVLPICNFLSHNRCGYSTLPLPHLLQTTTPHVHSSVCNLYFTFQSAFFNTSDHWADDDTGLLFPIHGVLANSKLNSARWHRDTVGMCSHSMGGATKKGRETVKHLLLNRELALEKTLPKFKADFEGGQLGESTIPTFKKCYTGVEEGKT